MKYAFCCFLKIIRIYSWYFGKGLRVPIDQRKPTTLDLDHDAMTFPKCMVHVWHVKIHRS